METKKTGKIEKIAKGRFMVSAAAAGDSGDTAVTCRLPDGSQAFILSDGMGKGMKAAAESQAVINKLRKLLKEGSSVAYAIKEVNRIMIEQSGKEENFATIDLAIIDKQTGRAKFYKMGAALSFLVRGNKIRRIQRPALPVGIIPSLKLTNVTAKLRPGDVLIMVSDGITEADRNDLSAHWLEEYLVANAQVMGPRVLAGKIVSEAQLRYADRETDDLTVVVGKIE